jgi:hypothetical protein
VAGAAAALIYPGGGIITFVKFIPAALLFLSQAQDTYTVQWAIRKGDKIVHSMTAKTEGKGKRTVQGTPEDLEKQDTEVKRYRDEILEVAGPEPTQVRRKVLEWWEEVKTPKDAKPIRVAKTLQGKTVMLKKKGEETDIAGAPDAPPEELRRNRLRHDVYLSSLPKKPVAVGHEWVIDEKALVADLRDSIKGYDPGTSKATGKFDKVEAYAGVQCAVVVFTLESEGTWRGWNVSKYSMKVQLRCWLSLDRGRLFAVRTEGSTTFSADTQIQTTRTLVESSSTYTIETENVFE